MRFAIARGKNTERIPSLDCRERNISTGQRSHDELQATLCPEVDIGGGTAEGHDPQSWVKFSPTASFIEMPADAHALLC